MNPKENKGLMRWAKARKTSTIAEHLEDKDIDDPKALAVWLRKAAIGEEQFKKNQDAARKKKK